MTTTRPRLCVLHTVASLPAVFAPLLGELAPGVAPYQVVDESLLADTIAFGPLPRTAARLAFYFVHAQAAGARVVLVTCSSIGGLAEQARALVDIPVFRVDQPMAREAVRTGPRVAVLAALGSTFDPTADLIRREVVAYGAEVVLTTSTCPGAYEARGGDDTARHDEVILAEARRLAVDHDVLVLAQASMAPVVDRLPADEITVPVLSSPRGGTVQLAALVGREEPT